MIDCMSFENSLEELKGEEVLHFTDLFVNSNPSEEEKQEFMSAAQKGINKVIERFEMRRYSVGDLIYAKELLSEIMDMILPRVEEEAF